MSAHVTGVWLGDRNREGNYLLTLFLPASGAGHVNFVIEDIALLQLAVLAVEKLEAAHPPAPSNGEGNS